MMSSFQTFDAIEKQPKGLTDTFQALPAAEEVGIEMALYAREGAAELPGGTHGAMNREQNPYPGKIKIWSLRL